MLRRSDSGVEGIVVIVIGTIITILVLISIWYVRRYPCIQYEAVWVKEWVEIQQHNIRCGENCNTVMIVPITHPAHWEQRCVKRGDREKGDVEAPHAPIPLQPLER
jgi:hypothetical protein